MSDRPRTANLADFQRNINSLNKNTHQEVRQRILAEQSKFAARGLASSSAMIGAAADIIDECHKSTLNKAMMLIHEFVQANNTLIIGDLVAITRRCFENLSSSLLSSVPTAGLPHQVVQYQNQYAAVFNQRLEGAIMDIEIGFIEGRKLNSVINTKGRYVLDDMLEDRVTLVKNDGKIERQDIPALVAKGEIYINDTSISIEVGDHLLRNLPNGLVEDYIVDDPVLHSGLGERFFSIHVHRSRAPTVRQTSTIQNITNNFHGSNSRANIGSTDNSTNISGEIGVDKLRALIEQIKPAVGGLPEAQQRAIVGPLATLEDEVRCGNPSGSTVTVALQSIKTVAEGATGNLIASGIVGLINSLMS